MGDGVAATSAARLTGGDTAARPHGASSGGLPVAWAAPDARRVLQLALAGVWLLDAVLQYQSAMFSRAFPQMLAEAAQGNPGVIASPITWSARLIDHHLVAMNALFATIQLLIALGIAWRPTVRLALATSIVWALAVWWLGEGLGMVLTGTASPVNGAPGAVILYGLLAVLLWPAVRGRPSPFVAGRAVGTGIARLLWVVLWGSLGYLALQPAVRAPQALSTTVSAMASGQPRWLAAIDSGLGRLLSQQGLTASVILAVVLVVIAAGIYLPWTARRAVLALAIITAAGIWVAQGLGGMFSGSGTDPNTGPLLVLLAAAYWPARQGAAASRANGGSAPGGPA
jgi:hypothetical protein